MNEEPTLTENDQVVVLTLLHPMSLDSTGKHSIAATAEELAQRNDLRADHHANHPAAFLVNVSELSGMRERAAADFSQAGHQLANTLESLPFPVIAAVGGAAHGGVVSWCSPVILQLRVCKRPSGRLRQWVA